MKWLHALGLPARMLAILAVVMLVDIGANAILFERANEFALEAEEADSLADRLAIAARLLEENVPARRDGLARELSSPGLKIRWKPTGADRPLAALDLGTLQHQLIAYQPQLNQYRLQLHLAPLHARHEVDGSMVLTDNSLITFHSEARDIFALRAGYVLRIILPTLLLVPLAWFLVYASLRPLRRLVRASRHVGTPHARPIEMDGPAEVRELIGAFNAMQGRIDDLLDANTQTMLAIGHDMRTPLARMQLRLDGVPMDIDERDAMDGDLSEMRDLLSSLQDFVALDEPGPAKEPVDLAAMAQTLVDGAQDRGYPADYEGPDRLIVMARAVSLRRAMSNLIENALHYGGNVMVRVEIEKASVTLAVEDDGPGIPEEHLGKVLQPFIRLDSARARNTAGMGLGLPIVVRVLRSEGAELILSNKPEGGLRALIRLPQPPM
ncbi:ATP-binding protein [Novosphingobium sediminicola]|uniref:histidine kinase n=1 Tax=Novosphingobium sediminicola TaxID=563162 RepID=A0A7W6G749_9SPHN|nr:ATP-binding protein [Novosphingobium sediminicola]MBB3955795.1 signal transduction histidine kinase [Novosphingobium sediminicola]